VSSPRSQRQCPCCKHFFSPSKFARRRQRFCAAPVCRQASKAHSQRQWHQKPQNRDYFRGPAHVERVRQWRRQHPGYRRGRKPAPRQEPLQDLAPAQEPAPQAVGQTEGPPPPLGLQKEPTKEPALGAPSGPALQDLALTQHPLVVGLLSLLVGEALQEKVAAVAHRLVEQGRRVLAQDRTACGQPSAFAHANL
jgi:hypothetical protein